MADESQLVALQKACEAREVEVANRKKQIVDVRLERQRIVEELESTCLTLSKKVSALLDKDRLSAARGSTGPQLQGVVGYAEKVRAEIEKTKVVLIEKRKDLEMAVTREKMVEEELLSARLETRRVEKLLEERNFQSLVHTSALDEITTDEHSSTILKRPTE